MLRHFPQIKSQVPTKMCTAFRLTFGNGGTVIPMRLQKSQQRDFTTALEVTQVGTSVHDLTLNKQNSIYTAIIFWVVGNLSIFTCIHGQQIQRINFS